MLYFAYSFISDNININNYYYLLSLCKTKMYNMKWKTMNFKKFVLNHTCYYFGDTIKAENYRS